MRDFNYDTIFKVLRQNCHSNNTDDCSCKHPPTGHIWAKPLANGRTCCQADILNLKVKCQTITEVSPHILFPVALLRCQINSKLI